MQESVALEESQCVLCHIRRDSQSNVNRESFFSSTKGSISYHKVDTEGLNIQALSLSIINVYITA